MTDTFIRYQAIRFSPARELQLARVNTIIEEYAKQGLTMSVRQLYYQLVARDVIPNEPREYDKLGALISNGRMAGLISWTAIEDRNRTMVSRRVYLHPYEVLHEAPDQFRRDLWVDQPWRPVVLVEKAALEGVISSICHELRVDFMATRGYNSQSETWRLGRRLMSYVRDGQRPIVLHLGDHDPSGIDMTRDLAERLTLFANVPVLVQRLALNRPQIDEFGCPANPAKLTDSRAGKPDPITGEYPPDSYIGRFGFSSWELDAAPPTAIRALIQDAVLRVRDEVRWSAALAREASDRDALKILVEEMIGDHAAADDEENDDDA